MGNHLNLVITKRVVSYRVVLFCLIILSSLPACKKDTLPVYEVPPEVEIYVQRFLDEGQKRGRDIEITHLTAAVIEELTFEDNAIHGLCKGRHSDMPRIELNANFREMPEAIKEQLVFHELGHCLLKRDHKDGTFNRGYPRSMMHSTDWQYTDEQSFKRDYYLDELFNTTTLSPTWATAGVAYNSIPNNRKKLIVGDQFSDNSNQWNLGAIGGAERRIEGGHFHLQSIDGGAYFIAINVPLDQTKGFEIEIGIRIVGGEQWQGAMIWGGESAQDLQFFGHGPAETLVLGTFADAYFLTYRPTINLSSYNKFTLRKVEEAFHFFLNEQFMDKMEAETLAQTQPRFGFYVGSFATVHVDYLNIYEID